MVEKFYEKALLKHRRWYSFFCFLALITPFSAFLLPEYPKDETLASMFQRSGAAVVVFAVIAEFSAVSIYNVLNPSGFASVGLDEVKKKYRTLPPTYTKFSVFLILIGTVIWGYGELFIKSIFIGGS